MNNIPEGTYFTSELIVQNILRVSCSAHEFIANNKGNTEEARIKAILSYITFYLTVEIKVVSKIKTLYLEQPGP